MPPPAKPAVSGSVKKRVAGASSNSVRNRQPPAKVAAIQRPEEKLIDLSHLTPEECEQILSVMDRDAALRKQEQDRVGVLKKEMRDLRVRGVIRNEPGSDAADSCARCRKPFGWLLNQPKICVVCSHRICKSCLHAIPGKSNALICSLCVKQVELQAMTGQWFELLLNKGRIGRTTAAIGELVQASIRRTRNSVTNFGSSVGSTIGDVKRAFLSRTVGDASTTSGHQTSMTPTNNAASDGIDADERNRKQIPQPYANQALPDNLISGDDDAVLKQVRVRRGRRHSSDEDDDDQDADRTTAESVGGGSRSGRPTSASSTSSSTYERQIKPPSPGSSAVRLSTGPIWDYRSSGSGGNGHPVVGGVQQQQPTMNVTLQSEQYRGGVSAFQPVRNPSAMSTSHVDEYRLDAFQRGGFNRSSVLSCASSVGGINVVTSDEDTVDEDDETCAEVDIEDDFITDLDSVAGRSSLHVGETPTGSLASPSFPAYPSSPRGAQSTMSPLTRRRTLAAAVREKADAILAADVSPVHGAASEVPLKNTASNFADRETATLRKDAAPIAVTSPNSSQTTVTGNGHCASDEIAVRRKSNEQVYSKPMGGGGGVDAPTLVEADVGLHLKSKSTTSSAGREVLNEADEVDAAPSAGRLANGRRRSSVRKVSETVSNEDAIDSEPEENEDLGVMFAAYGVKRKAVSQTNLDRMSTFTSSKESIVSMYSNAGSESFGKYPVTGEIEFGLTYNYKQNTLEIHIQKCRSISVVDRKRNTSDSYVKTYLLPDKTKNGKRKTRVKRHTTNPIFDEVIKYHVTKSELESRTLCVMVWNFDRFGRNDFLGEVNLGFDHHSFDDPTPKWYKLQDRQNLSSLSALTYKGDLNLSLRFVSSETMTARRQAVGNGGSLDSNAKLTSLSGSRTPNEKAGELQVVVKQARNLTAVRSNGFSDPFCKCSLLPDRSRGASQKSSVVKKNCNPVWNHTFVFENVTWVDLKERSIELTLWDYDRIISNDFLGGVRLNLGTGKSDGELVDWMDSKGEEVSLWQAMLDRPNCWIEGTLLLRLHMGQRK